MYERILPVIITIIIIIIIIIIKGPGHPGAAGRLALPRPPRAEELKIHQRGARRKQGVVVHTIS